MTRKRPTKITWKGDMRPDGLPVSHLGNYGIPPETLEDEALDALTIEQIAIVRQHPDLYRVTEAPEPKAAKKSGTNRSAAGTDRSQDEPTDTPATEPVDAPPATEPTDTKGE